MKEVASKGCRAHACARARVRARHGPSAGAMVCGGYGLPRVPTTARPGSAEKVAVLMERVERGEALFHPEDAR